MLRVVNDSKKSGTDRPDELRAMVEAEVVPRIRELESEMDAALKKARLLSLGLPLISGVGALVGALVGVPASALLVAAAAGSAGALKAQADRTVAAEKAKAHPFYFLWRARRP